jgi:effector-binding domain-containing protein
VDHEVTVVRVEEQAIAAVHERVPLVEIGSRFGPALDRVWQFVRAAGLTTNHNVFVYHHDDSHEGPMIEFGVQVDRPFPDGDGVTCSATPAGTVATTVHVGPYDQLSAAHEAVRAWCAVQGRVVAGPAWEVYGDWDDDPARLETTVFLLLD